MNHDTDLNRRSFLAGLGALAVTSVSSASCRNDRPPVSATRLADVDDSARFDVCIIGSGFAGAVLGESLVSRGIKTVMLESGFDTSRPPSDSRLKPLEVFRSSGPLEYPIASTRFRGVGGTSWLWGGFSSRLQPADFEDNAFTPKGCSWPIKYRDVEPYYEEAETSLGVHGKPESKYHPPRRKGYPQALESNDSQLKSIFTKAGVVASPQARSVPAARMALTHVPRFQASRHAALVHGGTVTRLLAEEGGRVIGAEVKDLDRNAKVIRARVFVVACGGLESPRLLLLSRAPGFPNGLGNSSDLVGRCFMEHRNIPFAGRAGIGRTRILFDRSFDISYQYYNEFKQEQLGGVHVDLNFNAIRDSDVRSWRFSRVAGKLWTPVLQVGAGLEMEPSPQNRVTLDERVRDYFGNPVTNLFLSESDADRLTRDRARKVIRQIYGKLHAEDVVELPSTWGHHHMGTCRMGDDPRTSVVDRNLRVHGTSNLFVAGSSVFVTSGCVGPTLTLTALSLRLAEHLRSQFAAGAFNSTTAMLDTILNPVVSA